MYKLKHIKHEYCKPQIDCKYQHLTEEEINFLYECDKSINSKITLSNRFKDQYKNLMEFEKQVNLDFIEKNKYRDSFPSWYIFRLIEYGRIHIKLEAFLSIRIMRGNILNVKSRLIDLDFISKFEDTAINKLGYSKEYVEKTITIGLVKFLIYMEVTEVDLTAKIYKYKMALDKKLDLGLIKGKQKEIMLPIATVLREMGYRIDIEKFRNTNTIITYDILEDLSPGQTKAVELYKEVLQTKSKSYYRGELSHIRSFLEFLNNNYGNIDEISKLNNQHITKYLEFQKCETNIRGKKNDNNTINNRIKAINRMLKFLKSTGKYNIEHNIITKYDRLRETENFHRYVSEDEIAKLVYSILNANVEEKYEQHRAILTILLDTGRRIHEVLVLDFNCYKDGQVFFHKTKKGESNWQEVGETTINAIRVLKKYASKINTPIYSKIDGLTIRRLVPSKHYKGRYIISKETISDYFEKFQIKHNIINEGGTHKYKLHDLKRIFVSSLTNAGVSPEATAKFLDQDVNNIVPYEISNALPISTLKKVEKKGLLIGGGYNNNVIAKESQIEATLNEIDIVTRNTINLISKINNPSETLPQFLGYCIDNTNYETCGDLICIACDEFTTDSLEEFTKYAKKMYRYIYSYKRKEFTRKIEKRLMETLEKCYYNIKGESQNDFYEVIREIKKNARKDAEDEKGN